MTDSNSSHTEPEPRTRRREQLSSGFRRSLGLTALGTLIPGAGLTQTRSRRLGWAIFGVCVALAMVLAFFIMTRGLTQTVLWAVSRPQALQAILVVLIVAGLLWCTSIVLTAVQARPARLDGTRSRLLAGFATVMVLLVAGSSFKATEYVSITQATVNDVFSAAPEDNGGKAPEVARIAEGPDPWADTPRVNVLLIGSDAGLGRVGTRTDSMIVASIDTKTGRTALIQLPRSLERAPLAADSPLRERYPSGFFGVPNSSCDQGSHTCLLTNLWGEAEQYKLDHPGSYPNDNNPGRTENRQSIQLITGLHIDQEVIGDLDGFTQMVDAMGGVTVNVKLSAGGTPLPIEGYSDERGGVIDNKGYFQPGVQHLNGYLALWYARTRAADGDQFRQARQRCVVKAIVAQVNPTAMLAKYADVAKIARDNIYTDIPAKSLPAFVELIERVQKATITSLSLSSADVIAAGDPDYVKLRALVKEAIAPPPPPKPAPKPAPGNTTPPASPAPAPAPNSTTDLEAAAYDIC